MTKQEGNPGKPVKHDTLAGQTRAEGEEYAMRMVEKKHTKH